MVDDEIAVLRAALERIARWIGEFPPSGRFWDIEQTKPMSYGSAFGSNGERDFMRQVARLALEAAPQPPSIAGIDELQRLRADGWSVAVHNDYRHHGVAHTFWLFTHPSGLWIKGEGTCDAEAIARAAASRHDQAFS